MAKNDSVYITVGKIGSTFGIRGWVKILSYTDPFPRIIDYTPWYLTDSAGRRTFIETEEIKVRHQDVIVKFAGFNNPEEAKTLTGKTITIERAQLPTLGKNEHYWSDLVGLTVIDQQGMTLGKVIYLLETGSNDVLVIKGQDNKEYGIPYLPDSVIKQVDLDKKVILVDWECS